MASGLLSAATQHRLQLSLPAAPLTPPWLRPGLLPMTRFSRRSQVSSLGTVIENGMSSDLDLGSAHHFPPSLGGHLWGQIGSRALPTATVQFLTVESV